ncbi:hypothetical protein Zmor_022808 [Zophobas morio]|uniref:Peptidase C1A papain C-terminal domain-containing protein n=1 Tax=Zophobas morio TaxID=2755281 RepID=A0AA38HX37_9CUCU|nr:hypothetical protein Zmor_022808 [Zophobas morio]
MKEFKPNTGFTGWGTENGTPYCLIANLKFKACCGTNVCGTCGKGYVDQAWKYWVDHGLVSGGDHNSNEGGLPYLDTNSHACQTSCTNTNYTKSYRADKHYGKEYYRLSNAVEQIQTEIMNHGPVEVTFTVYTDFYNYKSGVYVHTSGYANEGHAVKVIGWGTENNTPYWLIANSWGTGWGDLGGFFKRLRGQNHCGIESVVYGGTPVRYYG